MKRWTIALTAALALGACSDSTSIGGTTGGTFTLRTVNGEDLPALVIQQGGSLTEATSGSVSLDSDHSYQRTLTLRTTGSGAAQTTTETESGTWTGSGGAVTLTASGGGQLNGTLFDGALTLTQNGRVFIYRQ